MKKKTRAAPSMLLAAALAWSGAASAADPYPSRVITFVVPAVAGGSLDVIARTLADEMSRRLGQPIIVDNKPGAAGMVAVQAITRAAPDGYTVLVTHSGPILNVPYMFSKVPYDVRRDLSFVSQLATGQLVLAVNAEKVPARSMKELIAWAGANKGKVNYGSYGVGSASHLMSSYLSESRKLDMVHVAYKGEPPMLQDLVSGQINLAIGTLGSMAPHLDKGRIRALAVLGDQRPVDLPQVPTMAEAGLPDPELRTVGWIGMLVSSATPAPVVAKLESGARAASATTAMKARFQAFGMQPTGTSAAALRQDYDATAKLSEQLIRMSGAKMD